MPIHYTILPTLKLVLANGSGTVTATDILDHMDQLAADPLYISPMKKLVDYRSIDSISISQSESEIIAHKKRKLADWFTHEQCAFVSPGDLTYATSRVHQALVDSSSIATTVFRSLEEAASWLDISLEDLPDHG